MQARVGVLRDRASGTDPLVRFKCMLIGQWHPAAGAGALNCGWISCCVAAATSLHLCPMRRLIAVFVTHDDLLAGDRAKEEAPDDPDMHSSADTQARRIKKGLKSTPGYEDDIKRLCLPGRGPDEESFTDKVHMGHLRTGPGTPGFDTMVKGAKAQAGIGRQGRALRCAVVTVTGLCERPPVTDPRHRPLRASGKRGDRRISKRRLRDCAMSMPR